MRLESFDVKKESKKLNKKFSNTQILVFSIVGLALITILLYTSYAIFMASDRDKITDTQVGPFTAETLSEKILSDNGGASGIVARTTTTPPNFSQAADTESLSGMFAAADDYGTSYYFRGAKDQVNNNIIFGGFQWKIIRIDGQGNLRMIYNGTEAQYTANGNKVNTEANTQLSSTAYNTNYSDNRYVGYMYGSTCTDYATCHANTTASTIKGVVDTWYTNNIVNQGTSVTDKIVTTSYCNDRALGTGYETKGFGTEVTYYKPYNRYTAKTPTLKCEQTNDRLSLKAGLITLDELMMSGNNGSNSSYYLYNNNAYWTMSSHYFDGSYAYAWFEYGGYLPDGYGVHYVNPGARPVITLDSSVKLSSGNGSASTPYIVQ